MQTDSREINQLQRNVASLVEPIAANPLAAGSILTSVALKSGDNTVNHKLSAPLQGWLIVRKRGAAEIYDKQDSNSQKSISLILNASADVTVDLYVF